MPNTKQSIMTSGGRRPGAGKPKLPEEEKRRNTTIRLAPETVRRLALIRETGMIPGRVVDDLVEAFCRHAGIEPDTPDLENCKIQN